MDGVEQRERFGEIGFRLAREADDDVRGQADGAAGGANPGNFFEVLLARVSPAHGAKNRSRAGLHREVNVVAERGSRVNRLDNLAREIVRMRSGEPHAADARDGGDGVEQIHEIHAAGRGVTVGIDGLAEQLNFGVAGIGQAADFRENRIAAAAAFRAACVWDDAVGAGIVAALNDGEIGAKGIVAARDFGFESFLGIEVEAGDAASAGFKLGNEIGEPAVAG